ncbi:hypothetical protein B0H17DRAFT_1144874 [Mycena rosella]|uniref:Uncharacterized protein n=1 Tax=Mycena rosella TaxID=1033263 RepID=A0AAD7CRR0_MYCRO|nr:hypothetical protein B0H17DRAFT_1144874 [Mycena rosella]
MSERRVKLSMVSTIVEVPPVMIIRNLVRTGLRGIIYGDTFNGMDQYGFTTVLPPVDVEINIGVYGRNYAVPSSIFSISSLFDAVVTGGRSGGQATEKNLGGGMATPRVDRSVDGQGLGGSDFGVSVWASVSDPGVSIEICISSLTRNVHQYFVNGEMDRTDHGRVRILVRSDVGLGSLGFGS